MAQNDGSIKQANIAKQDKEIATLNLHVGQFVAGQMVTSIDANKYKVKMALTSNGVSVVGHLTDKLIPYSNIQGIDFKRTENAD